MVAIAQEPQPPTKPQAGNAWRFGIAVGVSVGAILAALMVWAGLPGGRAAFDQDYYHLPTIRQFALDWPNVDVSSYRSATTPGYHLLLAAWARGLAEETTALRLVALVFTIAWLAVLAAGLRRRQSSITSIALLAPLAASLYTLSAGMWLLPDNAAWLCVAVILILALESPPTRRTLLGMGICLVALVLLRQIHIWAAGLVWLAAWLGPSDRLFPTSRVEVPADERIAVRLRRLGLAFIVTVPAVLVLAWFVRKWGGAVPPIFQSGGFDPHFGTMGQVTTGGNLAVPPFLLTLLAIYGVFFGAFFLPAARQALRADRGAWLTVGLGAAAGLVLSLISPTSWDDQAGRYTGYWIFAKHLPVIAERSVFITLGATGGGAVLGLIWIGLGRRDRFVLFAALAGLTLTQTANAFAWQRYLEPMVLMFLVLAAGRMCALQSPQRRQRRALIGPIVLSCMLAGISARELGRVAELDPRTPPPPQVPRLAP